MFPYLWFSPTKYSSNLIHFIKIDTKQFRQLNSKFKHVFNFILSL